MLHQFIAFLLLALWMPASQHCNLIAVTGWEGDGCASACEHESRDSHKDVCSVVEEGDYTSTSGSVRVPMPELEVFVCFACLYARLLFEEQPSLLPASPEADPVAWIPTWAFDARAALPARAPTLT